MHKIAFQFGSFTVTWYGILVAVGFYAGLWNAARRAPRAGLTADQIWDMLLPLLGGGLIGARVLYVISYWRTQFAGAPWWEVFAFHHGGLVYYGGFMGAVLTGVVWARWRRLPLWRLADVLAPSVPLGHAFGRIGCLMNGCCFGRPCTLPWAIRFPESHETAGAPVHPTQIYEAAFNLALFAALSWLYPRRRFDGQVGAAYLAGYALIRSLVELFRGDYERYLFGFITPAHWVSFGLLAAGTGLYLFRRRTGPAHAA